MGRVSNWEDHAHRGMALKPTRAAVENRRIKVGNYLFHKWGEAKGTVIVQPLGTRRRKTVSSADLQQLD